MNQLKVYTYLYPYIVNPEKQVRFASFNLNQHINSAYLRNVHDCNSESSHKVIDEVCFPVVLGQPGQDGQEGEKESFPVEVHAGETTKLFDKATVRGSIESSSLRIEY